MLSGFDDFYGPDQLAQANLDDVILYLRASYPISWLKKPAELAFSVTRFGDIDLNNPLFREFLESKGENPDNRDIRLRIKPAWLHYGGYGHKRGSRNKQEFRRRLKKSLQTRGPYVVQPEIPPLIFGVKDNETKYVGNDQLFFLYDPFAGEYRFAGGQRIALPVTSGEACRGRVHGNRLTVRAEIVTTDQNLVVDKQSLNYVEI